MELTEIDSTSYSAYSINESSLRSDGFYSIFKSYFENDELLKSNPNLFSIDSPKFYGFTKGKVALKYRNNISNIIQNYSNFISIEEDFKSAKSPLPIATRYISEDGYYFIERYPFKKTIDLSNSLRKQIVSNEDKIEIWIPWTLTVFSCKNPSSVKIFYSHKNLADYDDTYITSAYPNSYENGTICFGQSSNLHPEIFYINHDYGYASEDLSVKYIYNSLFNEYFYAGWNSDLRNSIYYNILFLTRTKKNSIDQNKYPTLYNFFYPTKEYINEKLSHISSARRRIVSSAREKSLSELNEHLYMLLMFSTLSLEETLSFFKEYSKILKENNIGPLKTFQELTETTQESLLSYDIIEKRFDFWKILTAPVQRNKFLKSNVTLDNEGSKYYVLYYDSSQVNGHNPNLYCYEITYNKQYHTLMHPKKYTKFLRTIFNDSYLKKESYIYIYDFNTGDFDKISLVKDIEKGAKLTSFKIITYENDDILSFYQACEYYNKKFIQSEKKNELTESIII